MQERIIDTIPNSDPNLILDFFIKYLPILNRFRKQPDYSNQADSVNKIFNRLHPNDAQQRSDGTNWTYIPGSIAIATISQEVLENSNQTLKQITIPITESFTEVEIETIYSYSTIFYGLIDLKNFIYKKENYEILDQTGETMENMIIPPNLSITDIKLNFPYELNLLLTGDDYNDSRKFWLETFMEQANECLGLMNNAIEVLNSKRKIDPNNDKYSEHTFIDDQRDLIIDFINDIKGALGQSTDLSDKPIIARNFDGQYYIQYSNGSIFLLNNKALPNEYQKVDIDRLCQNSGFIDNKVITNKGVTHLTSEITFFDNFFNSIFLLDSVELYNRLVFQNAANKMNIPLKEEGQKTTEAAKYVSFLKDTIKYLESADITSRLSIAIYLQSFFNLSSNNPLISKIQKKLVEFDYNMMAEARTIDIKPLIESYNPLTKSNRDKVINILNKIILKIENNYNTTFNSELNQL